jgi:hypothetical protein
MSQAGYIELVRRVTVRVHLERSFLNASSRSGASAPTFREGYADFS